MVADAVIFDKDGTLLDFDAFWIAVSEKAIEDVLAKLGMGSVPTKQILSAFGVENGTTDIEGVLCKGTYEQMGRIVYDILKTYGCSASCEEVTRLVTQAYNENSSAGEIKPTCPELATTLRALKASGKRLAVVTTDNEQITRKCLKKLGIYELFDMVYTDNGTYPVKPDPYCALDFCNRFGLDKESVVMVGDTLTDVRFARNAGISVVGLAATKKNRDLLAPVADGVVTDIAALLQVLQ